MSRSRRIAWPAMQKLGGFALVMGAMWLVASLALLVLIGLSPGAVAVAAIPSANSTAAASTPSCFPLTESGGTCYNAGEFCPNADLNMSGVAANGTPIACEPEANGTPPHWRACTPTSTATGTLVCPAARAVTATPSGTTSPSTSTSASTGTTTSATPGTTTSAPAGAPATGGGTGPGISGALAAAGCAVIVAGAVLVFLSLRRRTIRSL